MDATRSRRLKDHARQTWYSTWRSLRFARHMGILTPAALAGAFSVLLPGASPAGDVRWVRAGSTARA